MRNYVYYVHIIVYNNFLTNFIQHFFLLFIRRSSPRSKFAITPCVIYICQSSVQKTEFESSSSIFHRATICFFSFKSKPQFLSRALQFKESTNSSINHFYRWHLSHRSVTFKVICSKLYLLSRRNDKKQTFQSDSDTFPPSMNCIFHDEKEKKTNFLIYCPPCFTLTLNERAHFSRIVSSRSTDF